MSLLKKLGVVEKDMGHNCRIPCVKPGPMRKRPVRTANKDSITVLDWPANSADRHPLENLATWARKHISSATG